MISKDQYWQSLANEFRIIKHLATKIPHDQHHHKPTEKQRTTLELLQFLSGFGSSAFQHYLTGEMGGYEASKQRAGSVTVENFPAAIDAEEARMKDLFAKFTDGELKTEISLWGRKQTKDLFLLDFLKMIAAYKMQLFLYAKQSGNHSIGTANVWAGMDMPATAPKA